MIWHDWWVWVVAGVVLAILEVVVPGYVFLGFSIGLMATGVLLAVGLLPLSLPLLVLIAAVLSLVAWLGLRRVFGLPGRRPKIWDRDINDDP